VSESKRFLLRLQSEVFEALEVWAKDDLRSINAQIAYLLREALVQRRRLKGPAADGGAKSEDALDEKDPGEERDT
jgi:hypothetical protein